VAKSDYHIARITKKQAGEVLLKYHYLKDISKGFKSGYNYGIFYGVTCIGACIFTGFPVPELSKGMLGLERDDQAGLFELSRLCLRPSFQKSEHNLASWFVSRSIKQLKKDTNVRVILSYADSNFHEGTIYKACNFMYYGLTKKSNKDFWILQNDGSHVKHSRGKTSHLAGEWRPRSRKHRFLMVFDKKLNVLWERELWK